MAENFFVQGDLPRKEKYRQIIPALRALVEGESDMIANLANITAALKEVFGFFWVGFYLVKGDELVLGPFQGPVACTRIAKGKGVCGAAWSGARSILVPDVDKFPGHISCNAASKSEVVVPVFKTGEVVMILDVDSEKLNDFDESDVEGLKAVCELIGQ